MDADFALRAAANWLSLSPAPMAKKAGSPMGAARTFSSSSGAARFYVVDLAPTGYVVVAPDDQMEPIVAFSHQDRFEGKPGNPLFDLLQKDMDGRKSRTAQVAAAGKSPAPASLASSAKWHKLLAERPLGAAPAPQFALPTVLDDPRVDPLLQSHWDQTTIWVGQTSTAVYNYYTPPYTAGDPNNFDAGCTATSWAQIMRYHQWPTTQVGTQSFPIKVSGALQRRALRGGDGNGGAYDWSNMMLAPDATIGTLQCQAIGALVADAGVANQMDYEYQGSAANLWSSSIRKVFKYANGVASIYPVSQSDFILALNTNLDAGLPAWVALANDHYNGEGHAAVVDGYGYNAGTLYHHLNMGWSGADDAWYNLPTVTTAEPNPQLSFDLIDDCVYNIDPTVNGEIVTGRVTGTDGNPIAGIPVIAQAGAFQYRGTTNARGIYAIKGLPSSTMLSIAPTVVISSNPARWKGATGHSADEEPVGNRTGVDFQVTQSATSSVYDQFVVAMRNEAAPGISGAFFSGFGSPSINDTNHIAFQATIFPLPHTGNSGIWADSGTNQCVLVALTGNAAPGVAKGIFSALGDPVYNNSDHVAFIGSLKTGPSGVPVTNATGIWTNSSGTLGLVALSGSQAAGCSPGVVFASFQQLVLPDQGGVIFLAALENGKPSAGVTAANNLGIWAQDGSGQLQLIARKGEPKSGSAGAPKINSLSLFANAQVTKVRVRGFNSGGDFVFKASYSDGTEPLFEANNGGAPLAVGILKSVPQNPGATFTSFGYFSLNNAGHTAFLATISGSGIAASNHTGIWAESGTGGWQLVARTGVAIKGMANGQFTFLSNPVNNDGDQVAFMGILNAAVTGIVKANAMAIWIVTSGSLAPVAGVGELAPGCGGATFASFSQLALPDQGGLLLVATLNGRGISAANNEGVWAVDTSGALRLIVRTGAGILGDVTNPITALSILTSSPATMPQPGSFNRPGNLVYKAAFRDGTQGIFTVVFP